MTFAKEKLSKSKLNLARDLPSCDPPPALAAIFAIFRTGLVICSMLMYVTIYVLSMYVCTEYVCTEYV